MKTGYEAFDDAIKELPEKLRAELWETEKYIKEKTREIRIRVNRPIQFYTGDKDYFFGINACIKHKGRILDKQEIEECFRSVCGYSVHTHQAEIGKGYVTTREGHRVGICGTAVMGESGVKGMREITSLNIRIAREIKGCADELIRLAYKDGICGLMIIGEPGCGKTTIIRDLSRQLASAKLGKYIKVAVIDERGEISGGAEGCDIGISCDVLCGFGKYDGINNAVRTLSPEVIVCDEIGSAEEARAITAAVNNGAKIVATAHASTVKELYARKDMKNLLNSGAFRKIAVMMGGGNVGEIDKIIEAQGG